MTDLPEYSAEELAHLTPEEQIGILIKNEDRVPRNVISECARRGEAMVEYLQSLHDNGTLWQKGGSNGEWWLRLHAVNILGLIPGERAGLLLVEFMRRMSTEKDENLQGWIAGDWHVLFKNKSQIAYSAVLDLAMDRGLDWYIRANAVDAVIDLAAQQGEKALDEAQAWAARIINNEEEDWNLRLLACGGLLDYPRPEYRLLLESMVPKQSGWNIHFDMDDVNRAYAEPNLRQERSLAKDPWQFYTPQAIADRQQRWKEEDEKERLRELAAGMDDEDDLYFPEEPYVRPEPKAGRNDRCPCGSGKKYKKCCLGKG